MSSLPEYPYEGSSGEALKDRCDKSGPCDTPLPSVEIPDVGDPYNVDFMTFDSQICSLKLLLKSIDPQSSGGITLKRPEGEANQLVASFEPGDTCARADCERPSSRFLVACEETHGAVKILGVLGACDLAEHWGAEDSENGWEHFLARICGNAASGTKCARYASHLQGTSCETHAIGEKP